MNRVGVGLLAGLVMGGPVFARDSEPKPSPRIERLSAEAVEEWTREIERAQVALREGRFEAAEAGADRALEEMVRMIERGPGAAPLVGSAVLVRGLARAGLERDRDAVWDYFMAIALEPPLEQYDLKVDGAAGLRLHALVGLANRPQIFEKALPEGPGKVSAPEKRSGRRPPYPEAKHGGCVGGTVIVLTIIDRGGVPTRPALLSALDPILSYTAMDVLREWRFKPARLDGTPVPVYYNLSVNFKPRRC